MSYPTSLGEILMREADARHHRRTSPTEKNGRKSRIFSVRRSNAPREN